MSGRGLQGACESALRGCAAQSQAKRALLARPALAALLAAVGVGHDLDAVLRATGRTQTA